MEKNKQTMLLIFVAGFIIGFIIASSVFYAPNTNNEAQPEEVSTDDQHRPQTNSEVAVEQNANGGTNNVAVTTHDNLIHVKDQKAGDTVFLSRVELTQAGWVAIQGLENGQPTNTLGAHRFDPGIHQETVTLLRATAPDAQYRALLYVDDGDKIFELEEDRIYTNPTGDVVAMTFETY